MGKWTITVTPKLMPKKKLATIIVTPKKKKA